MSDEGMVRTVFQRMQIIGLIAIVVGYYYFSYRMEQQWKQHRKELLNRLSDLKRPDYTPFMEPNLSTINDDNDDDDGDFTFTR